MAVLSTSGDSTFSASAITLITAALRIVQAIGEEETAEGVMLQNGLQAFNLLIMNIQARDGHVWLQEDVTLFLQPNQTRYQLGAGSPDRAAATSTITQTALSAPVTTSTTSIPVVSIAGIASGDTFGVVLDTGFIFWATVNGTPATGHVPITPGMPSAASSGAVVYAYASPVARPLKVTGARRVTVSTGAEVPLIPMTRLDFANLTAKSAVGPIQYFFFDPQTGQGAYSQLLSIMNIYQAPANVASLVRFTAQRPIQDFSNLANLPDVPAEWLVHLKWVLALELSPEYGNTAEMYEIIKAQAEARMPVLDAWDRELLGTSTMPFVQPIYQMIARALRICNAIGPQEIPTLGLANNAFMALVSMIQAWQASGIHVWCEEECILFPQPGQPLYRIGGPTGDHVTLFDSLIQTTLITAAVAGDLAIALASASGIQSGDNIGIQMENGTNFWTTVDGAPSGSVVAITDAIPSTAIAGAIVFDYTTPLIRPLRVMAGRRYNYLSQIENSMMVWARLDYEAQPNKTTLGALTAFFFDPQTSPTAYQASQQGSALVNLWSNPQNNQFGFRFTAQRPLATPADLSSSLDFPVEWQNAIVFNLAVDLWPEFGKEPDPGTTGRGKPAQMNPMTFQTAAALAAQKLQMAQGWDREPESIYFGVSMSPGYRR